jgi:peroxiredoxin (alkyl hydroperoxide reductase subunit C)
MKFTSIVSFAVMALLGNTNAGLPMPRTQAPSFKNLNAVTPSQEFTKLSLDDYKGKYVILVFYPFDFTYVCPTELIAFSESIQKFKDIGTEVIGISTDSHFTHLAWLKTKREDGGLGKINYPLIADISKQLSKDYGVLVEDKKDPMNGAAIRGMFILDKEHKIRSVQINDDAVGRNVDEALRLVQGFQFADQHGEVCPANWKPGDKTIKPDQIKKNEFFSQAYTS